MRLGAWPCVGEQSGAWSVEMDFVAIFRNVLDIYWDFLFQIAMNLVTFLCFWRLLW